MLKYYADNSDYNSGSGEVDALMFGGFIVDEKAEDEINLLMDVVKSKYGALHLPLKWNFRDLEKIYKGKGKENEYRFLLENSQEWRRELFERSLYIEYKVIIGFIERYASGKKFKTVKPNLTEYSFTQVLMRTGLEVASSKIKDKCQVILDWPDGGDHALFTQEYYEAYKSGKSLEGVRYHCGALKRLRFADSVLFAKSHHSNCLQFADLLVGASRDFINGVIRNKPTSNGYELTNMILNKYRGYPNSIVERGMTYSPTFCDNAGLLKKHISKILTVQF